MHQSHLAQVVQKTSTAPYWRWYHYCTAAVPTPTKPLLTRAKLHITTNSTINLKIISNSSSMNDKLLVEVQGENGAYYKAFVTDVSEEEIQLSFEKNWQPESRFPFARVRLPPPSPTAPPQFEQEQEIEVSGQPFNDLIDGFI